MKRTLTTPVTNLLLIGALLLSASCGDTETGGEAIGMSIESQDNIVSETGTLELTSGTLSIQSVALTGDGGAVPLIGPVTIDLSLEDQELRLLSPVPPGSYTGLRVELAPATEGGEMLDVRVRSVMGQESVRAVSELTMSGTNEFPEGSRTIGEASEVELHLSLRGMFFYLAPLADAVDGVYEAGENDRDFLTMDLIGMFHLRVLP
jgi:hypothetical protein